MTTPTPDRWLIVNADDLGLSPGVNEGILTAHDRGIVTSASLMVRGAAAEEAVAAARDRPGLALGLHVDLGEWVYRDGDWVPLYLRLPADELTSPTAVADEFARQLDRFRRLVGRDPSHLDSHQHVHRSEPLRSVMASAARALGVRLRHLDPAVRYCGDFYGQTGKGEPYHDAVTADALRRLILSLPCGITELACHPGLEADHDSAYRAERRLEVEALCDRGVALAVVEAGVQLVAFTSVAGGRTAQV